MIVKPCMAEWRLWKNALNNFFGFLGGKNNEHQEGYRLIRLLWDIRRKDDVQRYCTTDSFMVSYDP